MAPLRRATPGTAAPTAILLALLGLACILAYQALDAGWAEARAAQRELRGYATLASLQLGRRVEAYAEARIAAGGASPDLRRLAGDGVRSALAGAPLPEGVGDRAGWGAHPLWVELTAPDGSRVYRTAGWAPTPDERASWAEAKVGGYGTVALPTDAVVDTLDGALAGFTTRVALRREWAHSAAPGARARSRLPLLLTVFGLTLGLVGIAVVQLRRQQELVRLRDDFVSGVSHELRTPLAQIRLFAELLESGRLESAPQRERSVRVIAEESRRLSYLVENILHFSRGQRGALHLSAAPVEAEGAVREAVEAFAPLARAAGTELVADTEAGVIARVDRDALRQVLLNLLDNAVKYGPAGQRVTLATRLRARALHVWVDDEGPGVPPSERSTVWEPYRRLERDARSATTGSGIGLSVVRDLVELHGGRVSIEEAPGGGARFIAIFPGAVYGAPVPAAGCDTSPGVGA